MASDTSARRSNFARARWASTQPTMPRAPTIWRSSAATLRSCRKAAMLAEQAVAIRSRVLGVADLRVAESLEYAGQHRCVSR